MKSLLICVNLPLLLIGTAFGKYYFCVDRVSLVCCDGSFNIESAFYNVPLIFHYYVFGIELLSTFSVCISLED